MTSFILDNIEWITSALWQDLKAADKKRAFNEAKKKVARQKEYNTVCLLQSGSKLQAGFFTKLDNSPHTTKCLAALFASQYDNCAVKLELEEGTWICAIEDGLVYPGSEHFGPAEEMESSFSEIFQFREWETVIEINSYEESQEKIRELSEKAADNFQILPLYGQLGKKHLVMALVIALVVCLAGMGINTYLGHKKKEEARRLAAKQAEVLKRLEAKRRQELKTRTQFDRVWEEHARAKQVFDACYQEMSTFPLVVKGWLLQDLICSPDELIATWNRLDYGKYTDLPENAQFDSRQPDTTISKWERGLSVTPRTAGEELLKEADGAALLYQAVKENKFAVKGSITWSKPEVKVIPSKDKKKKPTKIVCPFHKGIWNVTGEYLPQPGMLEKLSMIPGVMISHINHIRTKEQWEIKGVIYVR